MSVELNEQDGVWAWRLGLRWGAWHPNLGVQLQPLGEAFAKYSGEPLIQATTACSHRSFGVAPEDATEEQTQMLREYLEALGQTATYAVEAAFYYRRSMVDAKKPDPQIVTADEGQLTEFANDVSVFLAVHPDLRFHMNYVRNFDLVGSDPAQDMASALATAARPQRPDAPAAQPYGVSHAGAEQLVAAWMRHLGAQGVHVTQQSSDGGIDVVSTSYVAQVKNIAEGSAVPVAFIRELAGVALVDQRKAAFFTSGVYSGGGAEFAARATVALFCYDAIRGTLTAMNSHARQARDDGFIGFN